MSTSTGKLIGEPIKRLDLSAREYALEEYSRDEDVDVASMIDGYRAGFESARIAISVLVRDAKNVDPEVSRELAKRIESLGDEPVTREELPVTNLVESSDGRVLPYFLAWLLGVPMSVLLLIYLIRGCR